MLRRKGLCLAAVVAVMATAAATPVVAGNGLYVGATAGASLFHEDKSDFDNAILDAFNQNGLFVTSGTSTLKKSSFAFGGIIGYQFIPEIAGHFLLEGHVGCHRFAVGKCGVLWGGHELGVCEFSRPVGRSGSRLETVQTVEDSRRVHSLLQRG